MVFSLGDACWVAMNPRGGEHCDVDSAAVVEETPEYFLY